MIFSEYKNILANKFMRDTNYIIIKDTDDLEELERQWELFKTSLTVRQQRLSDDRSIQIWNMTNQEHYETLKKELIQELEAKLNIDNTIINEPEEDESSNEDDLISNDNFEGFDEFEDFEPEEPKNLVNIPDDTEIPDDDNEINEPIDISNESFVGQIYNNMQIINEQESNKRLQHRRLNDTPYFTPSEMIDMGVHGNDNYYCPVADNDGLITNIRIPTWFDSYKNMCLDHIFEDYTKEWIDTLDMLYSDFDSIKESGDEDKILARKQSILDLGWNPEIPFNRRNRQKASKRINKLLDKGSPLNIFINLDKEIPDDDNVIDVPVTENTKKNTHQPVYIVFVQGKSPIISSTIKKVTKSPYSHSGISFDHTLKAVHSYNMVPKAGLVKESIDGYKDNIITVMAFFAPNHIYNSMKDYVMDFWINSKKTVYDFGIIFNKLINKNSRVVDDKYHQVCSTFVDSVMKSSNVVIDKTANVPSPAELYNSAKTMPNKIIEVYTGPADKYDANKVEKKMNKLLEQGEIQSIEEGKIANKIRNKKVDTDLKLQAIIYDSLGNLTKDKKKKEELKKKSTTAKSMHILLDEDTITEAIQDLDSAESNDIYHNIEDWESGKSNLLWVTGLSGSGKSTLSKDINTHYTNTEYVEVDNLQRAKMDNWDTTDCKLIDDYIESKGGLTNIFSYVNDSENISWKDICKEKDCAKQFDDFFNYVINYTNRNKNRRFIVEGVQIAMCSKDTTINKISKYPVIIKMNGPLKTEFRREKRKIKYGLDNQKSLIDIFKKVTNNHINWWKQGFYTDDWKELKYFKSHIGESTNIFNEGITQDIANNIVSNDKVLGNILKKIKNRHKYKAPSPSIKYYTTKTAPQYIFDKYGKTPYITEDDIVAMVFDPFNLKPCDEKNLPPHIYIYKVTYCDKVTITVLDDLELLKKYLRTQGLEIKNERLNELKANPTVKHFDVSSKYCYIDENVSESVLNEVKQFPIEFDKEGNLIIYKCRTGSISYGDEIADSVKLLESYRNENNVEGIKYELAKLWFINDSIEKKLKKRLNNDEYKELIDQRATCLNVFKLNLEYVMKAEKGFNFSDYYNSTPFSDNSVKITANTLKYSIKALTQI